MSILETLSSYVPSLVINKATKDPEYFTKPTKEVFNCVVLFTDISGFTALTERLAAQGSSGTEELTRLLNNYLGQLIDLIISYGGDIVKFAGDALLAIWPKEILQEDLPLLAQRVAQCCLTIQERLHNYSVSTDVRLSMKLVIAVGETLIQTLGGIFGRWELLVAGNPLSQISTANKYAKAGQILISPETLDLIKNKVEVNIEDHCHTIELQNITNKETFPVINKPKALAQSTAALRSFIPGAIRSRIDAGQTDWLAELRNITVLFINLPDLNEETPLEKAQAAMCALQTSLYRYEGSINKISVDDKGASLVAVMGLPPFSHEDDAARGLRAALAMQSAIQNLGFQSAIGVTTGQTFCGSVGSNIRREYTVMGDTVNLAARLMQAANKDILCDEATAKAAKGRLSLTALDPLKVKGKQAPIPVYRPALLVTKTSKKSFEKAKVNIIGRKNERNLLEEKLQLLKHSNKMSCVVIEGEAGIGKSRLIEESITQAQNLNLNVLVGYGDSIENTTAYFAWRNVVAQLFELENLPEDVDIDTKKTHISRSLPDDPKSFQLAPLLDAVLPWDWADNEYTAQLAGKTRADSLHQLLISILQHHTKQNPLVLIIEDAHWLDSGSWALLLLVCQQVKNLLLIVATRPMTEPIILDYKNLLAESGTEKIILNQLPVEEITDLVCYRLGVKSLPKAIEEIIISKAGGNPFFSEELAYSMRDLGFIQIKDGECIIVSTNGKIDSRKFPDTIQGVITSRVDRLTPAQQLTIKVASVIGRVFAFRTLKDIYPIEADKDFILEHFNILEQLDLTPLERPAPELAYIFKHIITQDVVYNLMLFSQRRQLHYAVANWHEKNHQSDLDQYYSYLAHHFCESIDERNPDVELVWKAIDYLQKAGEQAVSRYVNQEAIGFFKQALELIKLLPESKERIQKELQLELAIGSPIIATKGYAAKEVLEAYSHAQNLCNQLGDNKQLFPALRGLWAFYIGRADYSTAVDLAHQLMFLAEKEKDTAISLEAHRAMGNSVFWRGEFMLAQHHMEEGIKLYTSNTHSTLALLYGQDPDVANRGMQSWPLSLMGYPEQALKRSRESIAEALELSHPYSLGYALVHDACCQQYLLRVEAAYDRATEAIRLSQEKGFPNWLLAGMVVQGWAMIHKGKIEEGTVLVKQANDFWISSGSELVVPYFMTILAECYSKSGKYKDALSTLDEAFVIANKNNDHWYEAEMYRLKGEIILLENNDILEAEKAFLKAIDIAKNQQAKLLKLRATISLVKLYQNSNSDQKVAAREKLLELYRWFNEGFQMPDLQQARILLDK